MRAPRFAIRVALATVLVAASGISPAAAAAGKCTLAKVSEWPVRPGAGSPVIEGSINGHKVGILLDTGATRSLMMRAAAARLGLVRREIPGERVIAIGGETQVEMAVVDEIAIGNEVRRNWNLLVVGERDIGGDVAIVLGEDFFSKADVEFDLSHDAVRLFQARDCGGTSLAYWAPDGGGSVAVDGFDGAQPQIELRVEINGRPVIAQLDSGASGSMLELRQAAALGVTPDTAGVSPAGCLGGLGEKRIDAWFGPFETFRIGDELIRDPKISFADTRRYSTYTETGSRVAKHAMAPDMLLGADFLRSHRVLVSHSQRRMFFTYASGTVFPVVARPSCSDARPPSEAKPGGRAK